MLWSIAIVLLAALAAPIILFLLSVADAALFGVQSMSTSARARERIVECIERRAARLGDSGFYDLGCSYGTFAIAMQKRIPELRVFGVEQNPFRIFCARLVGLARRSACKFIKINLYALPLSDADIVYVYLPRPLMARLEEKLLRELKPGALVITNTTSFPTWQPIETHVVHRQTPDFERLFLYGISPRPPAP